MLCFNCLPSKLWMELQWYAAKPETIYAAQILVIILSI